MTDPHKKREWQTDEASADSFPASDPPSHTPVAGPGGTHHAAPAQGQHQRAMRDEAAARRRDPHGSGPAQAADDDEPAGAPTSERHDTETTVGRVERGKDHTPRRR